MSFFKDDFYSTKVSSRRWKGARMSRWQRTMELKTVAWLLMISFLLGALFTALLMSTISGQRDTMSSEGDVMAVAQPQTEQPERDRMFHDERIIGAVEQVQGTVVSVVSIVEDEEAGQRLEAGLGSGIIFEKQGKRARIMTNAHVIQNGTSAEVVLANGERREAEIIGQDDLTDLAVLEIDADGVEKIAQLGDSSTLQAGQTAIAIGNPLGLGFSQTITVGVISATSREIDVSPSGTNTWKMDVIQTDAAINQGNSGGALVNLDGQVIGINSLKVLDMGVEGLGFAIPINEAMPIIEELVEYGKVMRPYLGIYTQNIEMILDREELGIPDEVQYGIVVIDAVGPAKEAGLEAGDVIVKLDDEPSHNTYELRKYLYEHKQIGDEVKVTFYRGKEQKETVVKLKEWDPNE